MRFLEWDSNGELSLTKDLVNNLPDYAILSHTWGEDEDEVTFSDLIEGSGKSKAGYQKIRFCGDQAARDGLRYFWVDTCCINKSDAVELQKSINSMFRWYKNAVKCYVYLSDVSLRTDASNGDSAFEFESAFKRAKWFTRGWTLQELLAPQLVEFFSADYKSLGNKISLGHLIHERTRIPVEALQEYEPTRFSIDERVSWIAERETRHEEDMVYSLLGIFGIFLPLIYGEGRENAFRRLREEIKKCLQSEGLENQATPSSGNLPKFTVPFVRDSKFIGRGDIMQDITTCFKRQRRVALCGIGGIGKSQIAIEYCYTWKDRYPNNHIFWVHASTFDRFEQAYREIAREMSIPGTTDPRNDSLVLVRDWLSRAENGSWLFVLDNADDLDLFYKFSPSATKSTQRPISDLLPQNSNGSMIITTRDTRIGHRLTNREEVIAVLPLAPVDAEHLLRYRIPSWDSAGLRSIQELVEILGFIPLAITQAAAFIHENSITVKEYLKRLKESDFDLQDYLEEDLPDPRRYPDSENSVIRTWKVSFDRIAEQKPRAADLLSMMVLLDRQAIPKTLLQQGDERNIEFDKAVGALQAYSLIKTERGGTSFEVHRLIQLSTQRWLTLQNRLGEWQEKALELMVSKFPTGDYGTWQQCENFFLHAKSVTNYNHVDGDLLLLRATLLENMARYDDSQGRFEEAYSQYKEGLEIREAQLGKTHPSTLTAMSNVATVLTEQGKYTEAEALERQTLELTEEIVGKAHPETLITMNNLALVLNKQGKHSEAEILIRETLKLTEQLVGKMHPDTLISMNNLASTFTRQAKYAEAETLIRETLELTEQIVGRIHPDTLITMNNLASILTRQAKYTEGEPLTRQTLQLMEEVHGKNHPQTLNTVYSLAYLLQKKQEYEEASILYERACTGFKSSLGSLHPRTTACLDNYSAMLSEMREEAQRYT